MSLDGFAAMRPRSFSPDPPVCRMVRRAVALDDTRQTFDAWIVDEFPGTYADYLTHKWTNAPLGPAPLPIAPRGETGER